MNNTCVSCMIVAIPSKSGQWFRRIDHRDNISLLRMSQSLLNQVNGSDISSLLLVIQRACVAIPSKSGQWFRLILLYCGRNGYSLSQSLLNQVNGSDDKWSYIEGWCLLSQSLLNQVNGSDNSLFIVLYFKQLYTTIRGSPFLLNFRVWFFADFDISNISQRHYSL